MVIRSYGKVAPAEGLGAELRAFRDLERGGCDHETLLLWESACVCAVLPRSGWPEGHLITPAGGVPVLRRESGGGAVVLGRGCLNYALVVSLERRPELLDVERSYREILGAAVRALGLPETRAVGSDLVLGARKFSGNAQRRTRTALLHHGTALYDFDIAQIGRLLREPLRQPSYRAGRAHDAFLTNVPLSLDALLTAFEVVAADLSPWARDGSS